MTRFLAAFFLPPFLALFFAAFFFDFFFEVFFFAVFFFAFFFAAFFGPAFLALRFFAFLAAATGAAGDAMVIMSAISSVLLSGLLKLLSIPLQRRFRRFCSGVALHVARPLDKFIDTCWAEF